MILSQITKLLKTLPMWLMQTPRQVSFISQILHQLHISISFFIKRSSHSQYWQAALEAITVLYCPIWSFWHWHLHTRVLTHFTQTHKTYTLHTKFYTHMCTHTHIPSLGFVADFKPEPTFLFYTSPWHPEKYCLFSKNSLSLPPLFPHSFFLLSFFSTFTTLPNVSFLIDLK